MVSSAGSGQKDAFLRCFQVDFLRERDLIRILAVDRHGCDDRSQQADGQRQGCAQGKMPAC
jgi:hypothetical protein